MSKILAEFENENQNSDSHNLQYCELENKSKINFSNINFLATKYPNEILLTVLDKNSGFSTLFTQRDKNPNMSPYILIILGKACTSDLLTNLNDFIIIANGIITDILRNVQQYLVLLQREKTLKQVHLDSIYFLIIFITKYQNIMPSSSTDLISILLPLLDSTKEKCLKIHTYMYDFVSDQIKEINEQNEFFLNHHTPLEKKEESEKEKLHLQEPSESFCMLPILPTVNDINLPCSFLRPNVVKGKYKNTEHYLDVQYRLLREDYITPLRDGITEYLNLKKKNEPFNHCQNARVYTDVHVDSEVCMYGNLWHILQFSDTGFSKINWKQSKRFLTGSLLCLSLDDFQSMLFASVKKRDVKELEKGFLLVQFEEINDAVLNLKADMRFVVIETTAYFEAYRHNLAALLELDSDSLPLKEYIITVKNSVCKPRYLQATTTYDMRPLLLPLNKDNIKICRGFAQYEFPTNFNFAESVKVLDNCSWPTAADLNLDNSQYLALKAAVTKEFSIIQGPPGTGKTHVGLRIIQLLLHNLDEWFHSETNSLPILVVCCTNHALDQFLEGLLLFTSNLVRIGGQSSSKEVLKFQIHTLRENAILKKSFPSHLSRSFWETNKAIRGIRYRIEDYKYKLEKSSNAILSEFELQKHMTDDHFDSLKETYSNQIKNKNTICDWLGIKLQEFELSEKIHAKCDEIKSSVLKEYENEDAADIEYIEKERDIEFYDSRHIIFRRKLKNISAQIDINTSNFSKDNEWKSQNSNKKIKHDMRKYIKQSLECCEAMTNEEAMQVKQVWKLNTNQRWRLYKYWLQQYIYVREKKLFHLQEKIKTKFQEIEEIKIEEDLYILRSNDVVGMTTNGAAKYRHLIKSLNPAILIVEEAAEILESHIVTSLAPNTQHVIFIGDQQQLRPSPTVHMLAVKYDMNISMFERMIINGVDYCRLSVQHRMRPEIAALIVPHIYPNLENHKVVTEFENIRGVKKSVFFVSHSFNELSENESKSKVNEHEAKFLIKLCKYLLLQGYEPSQITVLTTYSGQLLTLKNLATDDVKKIHFTVVDNFQGEENDIILISFVRSNDDGIIGFLKVPNRVCVALSRAKKGLFCIGNFSLLAEKSTLWKNIVESLITSQSIGPAMQLMCQNHPNTVAEILYDTDFKKVPDGGCERKCESRLPCGHACQLFCHPFDQSHENIKCDKPCMRICKNSHPCEKICFEECYCEIVIERILNKCGHVENEACGKPEEEIKCRNPCKKTCEKQHPCDKKCFQKCYCEVLVDRTLGKCGHTIKELCGKPEEKIICKEPCIKKCKTGHLCEKKCFEDCYCEVLVDRTLRKCGHTIMELCGKPEEKIICKEPCIKKCKRNHLCEKKCFEDCFCEIITDTTVRLCGHTIKESCGKNESEIVCSYTCDKTLNCNHPCFKKCGEECTIECEEPCLKICRKGHICEKKCFERCGPCEVLVEVTCMNDHKRDIKCFQSSDRCDVLVEKILSKCGHTVKIQCWKSVLCETFIMCNIPCEKTLACSHSCCNNCGDVCERYCDKPCLKTCDLGHQCKKKCFEDCFCEIIVDRLQHLCGKCDKKLNCNHPSFNKCGEKCTIECEEPCLKTCRKGHVCKKKCFEKCSPCEVLVDRTLSKCGHTIKECCGKPEEKIICKEPCMKKCKKGHLCKKKCFENCFCEIFIDRTLHLCGHTVKESCGKNESEIICSNTCDKKINCNYPCSNKCGEECTIECGKPCLKTCKNGHLCKKKCFEKCSLCEVLVDRTLSICSHTIKELCGKPEEKILCKEPCMKKCKRGHLCEKKCFENCFCETLIDRTLHSCGHTMKELCGKDEKEIICSNTCDKKINCNHPCFNKCGEECTIECEEPCLKTCRKGHLCEKKCFERCGPCEVLVEVTCMNDHKHDIKCFQSRDRCDVLVEKTLSKCGHMVKIQCWKSVLCEVFIKCNIQCEKTLACSHQCSYNCGDTCKKYCNESCRKTCDLGH